jgi:hypothetical protein
VDPHRIRRLNLQGTKANIVKPKMAFKIKKRPEGTGGTGLTSHGIFANAALATGKGCQNKFK